MNEDLTKVERIHLLLVDWHLAREPGVVLGYGGGDGDCSPDPRMPATWNRSYRELERCIKELRSTREVPSRAFHHFQQRYLTCQTVRKRVHYRPGGSGKPVYVGLEPNEAVVTSQLRTESDPLGRPPRNANGRVIVLEIDAVVQRWRSDTDPHLVAVALEWICDHFAGEPFLPQWGKEKSAVG